MPPTVIAATADKWICLNKNESCSALRVRTDGAGRTIGQRNMVNNEQKKWIKIEKQCKKKNQQMWTWNKREWKFAARATESDTWKKAPAGQRAARKQQQLKKEKRKQEQ